jgi:FkbM family methyltransferase
MNKLIFDIGAFMGDDTDYYLAKGYDVISVEPVKEYCNYIIKKHQLEISQNRLKVVNKAVSDTNCIIPFYKNNKIGQWSSFDKRLGERRHGGKERNVECITLTDLFNLYGVPYYLKIDIEGWEYKCLSHLTESTKPQFLSFEMNNISTIDFIKNLGYTKFKLIDQKEHITDNNFKLGSSGVISDLYTDWVNAEQVKAEYSANYNNTWFDIHATF